jgi:hypothetical protein
MCPRCSLDAVHQLALAAIPRPERIPVAAAADDSYSYSRLVALGLAPAVAAAVEHTCRLLAVGTASRCRCASGPG